MTMEEQLKALNSKQTEWVGLNDSSKVSILQELIDALQGYGYDNVQRLAQSTTDMMGIPSSTDEGAFEGGFQGLLFVDSVLHFLQGVLQTYQSRVDFDKNTPKNLKKLPTRRGENGQVIVQTFPLLKADAQGQYSSFVGEIYLDPKVKDESQVEHFKKPTSTNNAKGVCIVLGAGNHNFLCVVDLLHNLFVHSDPQVVLLKLHPLRGFLLPHMQTVLQPLIQRGYLDIMLDPMNLTDASALVHHELVTRVHLTGGKATHDAIVWGPPGKEQEANKKRKTPALKHATMFSELGAVSPWIVVPGDYTAKELTAQAKEFAYFVHSNASCNCNSPKVIVIPEASAWNQRDDFLQIVHDSLEGYFLPVPYYPGCESRWNGFRKAYPDAVEISSTDPKHSIASRGITKGGLNDKPLLLPILKVEVTVDLSTAKGRAAAKKEYAFLTEPFGPVYTVATLKTAGSASVDDFCETAMDFCNNYLFGSLSGTVTVSSQPSTAVTRLIEGLHYGAIGVNLWAGILYTQAAGIWGAFPGEDLAAIESGIGQVNNVLCVRHAQKYVMSHVPLHHSSSFSLKANLKKEAHILEAATKFTLTPGVTTLTCLLCALAGIDGTASIVVLLGALLAVGAYFVMLK